MNQSIRSGGLQYTSKITIIMLPLSYCFNIATVKRHSIESNISFIRSQPFRGEIGF